MIKPQPYILKNTIQHYEWGTKGKNAYIPKLLNIKAEKDKPYAELWMGAHPKASSKIIISGKEIDLAEVIRHYPIEMLGRKTAKKFSNTLPFLFKVLSAGEALSIQVHPSKGKAIALHKKDPINYPDSNHKLEIAIALDSLTALVGFKPLNEILKALKDYPEIPEFIGFEYLKISGKRHSEFISESHLKMLKQVQQDIFNLLRQPHRDFLSDDVKKKFVKKIFTRLLKRSVSDEKALTTTIRKLKNRLSKKKNQTEIDKYFLELSRKYKNDIGLLILFFLNLVHLKRGEAIFTKPGIPHAYLKGNILECMSNSDNVIRAGLTPKYKDIGTLLKVLTCDLAAPQILKGQKKKNAIIYQTDAKEFVIQFITSKKNELKFDNQVGPRILLVLEGAIKFLFMDGVKTKSEKILKGESVLLPSILSNFRIASEKPSKFVLVSVPA
jgi:mannose-6-phosphate isomerase